MEVRSSTAMEIFRPKLEKKEVYTSSLWTVTGDRAVPVTLHIRKNSVELDIGNRTAVLRWTRMKPMRGKCRQGEGGIAPHEDKRW